MIIHDISRDIVTSPVYDGDPQTEIEFTRKIENGDSYNLSRISMCAHTGTHVDAPLHFCENGSSVSDIRLNTFYGKCSVVEVSGILTGMDMDNILPGCKRRLILKGNGEAFLSHSAAIVLSQSDVRLVGTDAMSIAPDFDEENPHRTLAEAGIVVIEGLDLSQVSRGVYDLCAFPIKLGGLEAAPCRAILLEQERGLNRR